MISFQSALLKSKTKKILRFVDEKAMTHLEEMALHLGGINTYGYD